MPTFFFATTNERKLNEARLACRDFQIQIEQIKLELDEIQSRDIVKIAQHKAEQAFSKVHKPIVITDTAWNIPALNGFPGGYMKDVADWFTPMDFINLVATKTDKRIGFSETIVYQDHDENKVFSQEYVGQITDRPRGNGNSIEQVAEFNGFTIAERHDQGLFSHNPKEYIWYQFAQWFSAKA